MSFSSLSAEEQLSYSIERETKKKRERVINGIEDYLQREYPRNKISRENIQKVFQVLENYCKILHTGNVKSAIPARIFHSSNMAIKNCTAYKMQQKVTDFFDNNINIKVDAHSPIEILKMLITPKEYDEALQSFVDDKSSSSSTSNSSPRTPRSPKSFKLGTGKMSDVDGGSRRKKRKTKRTRKKTRKTRRTK